MRDKKRMFAPYGCKDDLIEKIVSATGKNVHIQLPKYVYVLSRLIYYHTLMPDHYDKHGVAINVKILSKLLGKRDSEVKHILDNLVRWGYILLFRNYYAGVHSRCYKLAPKYENSSYCMLNFDSGNGKLVKKLLERTGMYADEADPLRNWQLSILNDHITVSTEGLKYLKQKYNNIYMDAVADLYGHDDLAGFMDEATEHIPIEPEDMGLLSFVLHEFYATRPDKLSRIYTNFCSLKREHRKYILMDGKPMYATDLVNSQLVFAIPVIQDHIDKKQGRFNMQVGDDIQLYRDLAESGKLYEAVAAFAGQYLEFNDRNHFKQRFFRDIFFSKLSAKRSKVKDAFNALFPVFAEVMADIKKDDHALFAVSCQRYEASIMVDSVLARLKDKGIPALSLHDSIYVNDEQHLQFTETLIRTAMKEKYGVNVQFKREVNNNTGITPAGDVAIYQLAEQMKGFDGNFDSKNWINLQKRRLSKRAKKLAEI